VGEFEKSFLMVVPTGFRPINNACCWQVGNLKVRWKREKHKTVKRENKLGEHGQVREREEDSSFPTADL
jgi:hypothetical protein